MAKPTAIVASASEITIGDRKAARELRGVRAVWQSDAFMFRDSLPEVRFASEFMANCSMRMRVYVGIRSADGNDATVAPTDITSPTIEVPPEIIQVAENAVKAFTNQTRDFSSHQRIASVNLGMAGEAYVLGITDPETHQTQWTLRSVNEITVYNDTIKLREGPIGPGGGSGFIELDPKSTFLCRVWIPDPQYSKKADSQMKAIANECEALLILRRGIRSKGRSRLSRNALLAIPSELTFAQATDGRTAQKGDPFVTKIVDAMMTPIADEGSASSVVPIIIRGAKQYLDGIKYIDMNSDYDQWAADTRKETVINIATGMDLPAQITLGSADVNHWSLFLIDEGTFKYHIEPQQIAIMRCYTEGFLVPFFKASLANDTMGRVLLDEWLPRLTFWYDPTDLLSHPDKSKNAMAAFDRMEISGSTLRTSLGFDETDKPSDLELELRMVRIVRALPANLLIELYHQLNPAMQIPPIDTPGTVPGIGPDGKLYHDPALPPGTPGGVPGDANAKPPLETPTDSGGLPSIDDSAVVAAAEALMASASPRVKAIINMSLMSEMSRRGFRLEASRPSPSDKSKRLSRQLAAIDRELRTKVITAANAAIVADLNAAGLKLRRAVRTNAPMNKLVRGIGNSLVGQRLGKDKVEMAGFTASGLMNNDYGGLEANFRSWTKDAQDRALIIAAELAGIDEAAARRQAGSALATGIDAGWASLKSSLDSIAQVALYNPHPNADELTTLAGLDDSIVPTGTVRVALALTGGGSAQDFGSVITKLGAEVPAVPLGSSVPFSGVATGATFQQVLTDNGCQQREYEWEVGPTSHPFDPHAQLGGTTFTDFTDEALKNDGDFPNNAYFFPGDHQGCMCDANAMWVTADDVAAARDAAGIAPVDSTGEDDS